MPWPVNDLDTTALDSETDRPPRAEFLKISGRVMTMIEARGTADGVASLDANAKVPDAQIGRGQASGVASLDGTTKVPDAQIGRGAANGVASLDANGKVPAGELSQTAFRSGDVKWTFRADAEDGWTEADGRAVSRVGTYAGVFAAYGTTFGEGDGATTFNLPNVQRRTMIGAGGAGTETIGDTLGSAGGEETHTLIVDEMPQHTHVIGDSRRDGQTGAGAGTNYILNQGNQDHQSAPAGGDGAHNNMQPSIVARCLIKL